MRDPQGVIVTVAVAVLTGLAVLLLAYLWRNAPAPVYYTTLAAVLAWAAFIVYQSLYSVGADEMIASYLLGTYRRTYVTGSYIDHLSDVARQRVIDGDTKHGLLGFDIVFLLWPLWAGIRIPTTTVKLPVHVGRVFTKNQGENYPRIRLHFDTTIFFRFSPKIAKVVQTFQLLRYGTDLAQICDLKDNEGHVFQEPRIAGVILPKVQETVLEAMRIAASHFTWEGAKDIVENKSDLERDIICLLSFPETTFVQGGFLVNLDRQEIFNWLANRETVQRPEPSPGEAVVSFDLNVEEIRPEPTLADASELEKAIDRPMIGLLEGRGESHREELRRAGEARGLKKIADELGAEDKMEVKRLETIRDASSNTAFGAIGSDIPQALAGILKKFTSGK